MIFFTSPVGGGPPEVRYAHPVRLAPAPRSQGRCCSAPCKLLRIRHLTKIRVMVFTTLKIPKPLLLSSLQVAFTCIVDETTIILLA